LPKEMLRQDELKALRENLRKASLYQLAARTFKAAIVEDQAYPSPGDFNFVTSLPAHERDVFMRLKRPYYDHDSSVDWTLGNISRRVFVRADSTAALTGASSHGPFIRGVVGLGQVLLSQIC